MLRCRAPDRGLWRPLSGWWVLLGVLALGCGGASEEALREEVFRRYIDAVNANDVAAALAQHTEDPEFSIPGQRPIVGSEAMRALLQWDSVLGSELRFDPGLWVADTLIVGAGVERNAWFRGIGLDSVQYSPGTRFVFAGRRIKGVLPSSLTARSWQDFETRVGAFMAWAQANAPEVAELAPGGQFTYDAPSARRWLDVLARYPGDTAGADARTSPQPEPWLDFEWPEADALFQGDRHWVGGDGAYSIDLGQGRVLWLFGDSWVDARGMGSREGAEMVSNTLAIQHGYDPSAARVDFHWGRPDSGGVGAFFPDVADVRYWPGHGVRIDDVLLLFLMEVRTSEGGPGFAVSGWTAVLVENPDAAPPDWRLRRLAVPYAPEDIVVGSGGVLRREGHVYAFSAREPGPGHEVYLVRWREEAAERGRLEEPEWWAGPVAGWVPYSEPGPDPRPVFGDGQTEFTVHWDEDSGRFLEFQSSGFGPAVVVRRSAPALTGPWSAPDTVFVPPQVAFPRVLIYQGKAHPHLEGAELVLTYSTNSLDFEDHFREEWLYYPRFVRLGSR